MSALTPTQHLSAAASDLAVILRHAKVTASGQRDARGVALMKINGGSGLQALDAIVAQVLANAVEAHLLAIAVEEARATDTPPAPPIIGGGMIIGGGPPVAPP